MLRYPDVLLGSWARMETITVVASSDEPRGCGSEGHPRLYANRPRSRILDDPVVFNVVGTIGLILFISVLALWALARFFRGATGRLVHRLSERA